MGIRDDQTTVTVVIPKWAKEALRRIGKERGQSVNAILAPRVVSIAQLEDFELMRARLEKLDGTEHRKLRFHNRSFEVTLPKDMVDGTELEVCRSVVMRRVIGGIRVTAT